MNKKRFKIVALISFLLVAVILTYFLVDSKKYSKTYNCYGIVSSYEKSDNKKTITISGESGGKKSFVIKCADKRLLKNDNLKDILESGVGDMVSISYTDSSTVIKYVIVKNNK